MVCMLIVCDVCVLYWNISGVLNGMILFVVDQVEAVREECNKNITVMAEEIKTLETVSSVVIVMMLTHSHIGMRREEQLAREGS